MEMTPWFRLVVLFLYILGWGRLSNLLSEELVLLPHNMEKSFFRIQCLTLSLMLMLSRPGSGRKVRVPGDQIKLAGALV